MEEGRAPVSQSPLYQQGKSLTTGAVSARRGLASNLALSELSPDQCQILNNMQMHRKRGIFTKRGTGYAHVNGSALFSGNKITKFGRFISPTGVISLLAQGGTGSGAKVQSLNLTTGAGTDITGLTGLTASKKPCMRAFAPSTQTTQPITVYCNGDIEPRKIITTDKSAPLTWGPATVTEQVTIGGTHGDGDVLTLTVEGDDLPYSPMSVSYTADTGGSREKSATGLAQAINDLGIPGVTAKSKKRIISIEYPSDWNPSAWSGDAGGGAETFSFKLKASTGMSVVRINYPYKMATLTLALTGTGSAQMSLDSDGISGIRSVNINAVTNGNTYGVQFTSTDIAGSPLTATVTATANDDTASLAEKLKIAINGTDGLRNASIIAFTQAAWPMKLNGKTYSKPSICFNFGERMVYTGFADADTRLDVVISNHGSAEKFIQNAPITATDAVVFSVLAELGGITGGIAFRPNAQTNTQVIVIGQELGISMITGSDSTSYSMDVLTSSHGIINNECFAQCGNELIYASKAGVFPFSALVNNETQPERALTYNVQDLWDKIDWDNAADMCCVHNPKTQEVIFYFPYATENGENRHALVMNYRDSLRYGLDPDTVIWSSRDGFKCAAAHEFKNQVYGATYDGFIQKWYQGDKYNLTPIDFTVLTAPMHLGTLQQGGRMRNMLIVMDGGEQRFTINTYRFVKYGDGSMKRLQARPYDREIVTPMTGGTTFPDWMIGFSSFPFDHVQTANHCPQGPGIMHQALLTSGNNAASQLDFSHIEFTMSIGGKDRR